jgi:hypothetical protein
MTAAANGFRLRRTPLEHVCVATDFLREQPRLSRAQANCLW